MSRRCSSLGEEGGREDRVGGLAVGVLEVLPSPFWVGLRVRIVGPGVGA